jgi:hypothetical protein
VGTASAEVMGGNAIRDLAGGEIDTWS